MVFYSVVFVKKMSGLTTSYQVGISDASDVNGWQNFLKTIKNITNLLLKVAYRNGFS